MKNHQKITLFAIFMLISFTSYSDERIYPKSKDLRIYTIEVFNDNGSEYTCHFAYNNSGKLIQEYRDYSKNEEFWLDIYEYIKDGKIDNVYRIRFENRERDTSSPFFEIYPKGTCRFLYDYEFEGENVQQVFSFQELEDSIWVDKQIFNRIYDKNENLIYDDHGNYYNGRWNVLSKRRIEYDNKNNIISEVSSVRQSVAEEWTDVIKYEYKYDKHNSLKLILVFLESDGDWDHFEKTEKKYNVDGRILSSITSKFKDSSWVIKETKSYTYDKNGYPSFLDIDQGHYKAKIYYEHNSTGQLVKMNRHENNEKYSSSISYQYDRNSNLSRIVSRDNHNFEHYFSDNYDNSFYYSADSIIINQNIYLPNDIPETDSDFVLYPNPCYSELNIYYPDAIPEKMTISDVRGELIREIDDGLKSNGQQTLSVVTDDLPPGIYFLEIYSKGNSITKKFIKQE
jgi:hypothetical protein